MVAVVQSALPKAERIGSVLFCDKLPYPTHYVKEGLACVVFVPNEQAAIARARLAIGLLIQQGRLRDADVRLRMNADEKPYDFAALIDGFLGQEALKVPQSNRLY